MKDQLECSLERPEEGEQGPNSISQGMDAPHATLSLGAASLLQQIAAWQISHEQPEAVQAISNERCFFMPVTLCTFSPIAGVGGPRCVLD